MEQRVEFPSDGQTLVGRLFRPDDAEGALPTVVAAGRWCYTKEIVLPQVARIINDARVQVLTFDYAGFGESSGTRRQHLDPWQQISDYRNAITHVESRQDADADKIGAFGISYSGGHVLILAAIDPRVKAVISVVPVVDGYATMKRVHGEARFADFEQKILDGRRQSVLGVEDRIAFSSLTPIEGLTVWPFPRIHQVFHQIKESEAPLHEHWSTTESAELLLNYSVRRIVDKKVAMIVAENDNITAWDLEVAAFNQVASPFKQLSALPAVSHMSLYSERRDTNIAGTISRDWFGLHLAPSTAIANAN
ncbi:alpha/beta fold hydrolase [Mycolicibacterium sp. CBMA 361]|uniref:alpha/beta hydrolase n=1 Tax=Mycolicibacterium sp. CBMA 361 TaxID=2606610 RepID=UPI0012DF82C5|nr:alpha/beta fold hydrolase [Mycolicibacterium sp. CBMA 361]MUM32892.1 alpha/beta hydrolase [Mycolicibacterium sp. CBMA 361]